MIWMGWGYIGKFGCGEEGGCKRDSRDERKHNSGGRPLHAETKR
jgi:hypothetical protein